MILITKENPPHSFVQFAQSGGEFDNLQWNVKHELKLKLLTEQGWLCGYCQQRIKSTLEMKIEHHCDQSICNGQNGTADLRMDYPNLMAVCLGHLPRNELICDTAKARATVRHLLPISISPWNNAHMNGISYGSLGLLKSSNTNHQTEISNVLNLNANFLREKRDAIKLKIFASIRSLPAAKKNQKLKKLVSALAHKQGSRYPSEFPGIYLHYLKVVSKVI